MLYFKKYAKNFSNNDDGYTLLELLVVLVILTLIVGIAGPQILRQFGKAKSDTARIEVNRLVTEVEFFRVDVGRFPTSEEGLSALLSQPENAGGWSGPYLSKASQVNDPWDNPYLYSLSIDGRGVEISSLGADGVAGGTGEDTDVSSVN